MAKTKGIKYVGPSHYREISAKDFNSVGVEGQGKIHVAREEPVEVLATAADWLLKNEPDDWQVVDAPLTVEDDSGKGVGK